MSTTQRDQGEAPALGRLTEATVAAGGTLPRRLRDGFAAILIVDRTTGEVLYADPIARAMVPGDLALPVGVQEWSRAAGLMQADGSPLDPQESPVTRAARGSAVSGEAVLVPARRRAEPDAAGQHIDTPASAESRVLWATAFPLEQALDLSNRSLVAFLDVGPGWAQHAGSADLHLRALGSVEVSFTIADPHQPDSPLIWVNSAFTKVTGYELDEVVGLNCRFLQGPGSDQATIGELRQAQREQRSTTVVLLNYRRDGTPFWNEISLSPVYGRNGQLTHIVGVQTDVTARVGAKVERERLLAEERKARAAAEAAAAAARTARDRLEVLARVTEVLSGTLDIETALGQLTRLLVPSVADLVTVDLSEDLTGDTRVARRVALAAVDPQDEETYTASEIELPRIHNPASTVSRVLASGRPVLMPQLPDGYIDDAAVNDRQRDAYLALQLRSVVVVPLVARDRTLGVLSLFTTARSGREYSDEELRLAVDLGRRAALLVDNARLFAREHAVSEALQRSLLPALPQVPGLSFAARYLAASDTAQVGGDWYDVLVLADGSVGVAMGDVMGHDLPAAAAMGQLRSVLRSYAYEGSGPGDVLDRLDRLVQGLDMAQLATAFYAVLLLGGDVGLSGAATDLALLRYANAGHLPPLLRTAEGIVRRLDGAQSVLVGAAPPDRRREARELLPPGSTLLLYTDGLVEHRGRDVDDGIDQLAGVFAEAGDAPVQELVDLLVDRLVDLDNREDDAALLLVRLGG